MFTYVRNLHERLRFTSDSQTITELLRDRGRTDLEGEYGGLFHDEGSTRGMWGIEGIVPRLYTKAYWIQPAKENT